MENFYFILTIILFFGGIFILICGFFIMVDVYYEEIDKGLSLFALGILMIIGCWNSNNYSTKTRIKYHKYIEIRNIKWKHYNDSIEKIKIYKYEKYLDNKLKQYEK